jgi:hypothetical protein
LENTIKLLEKDKINAAVNQIGEFQEKVQEQSGKKIPKDLAEKWIAWTQDITQDLEYL